MRAIGVVFTILAILVALLTLAAVVLVAFEPGSTFSLLAITTGIDEIYWTIIVVLGALSWGGLSALVLYAIGGMLRVMVSIEENTRYHAVLMRDWVVKRQE